MRVVDVLVMNIGGNDEEGREGWCWVDCLEGRRESSFSMVGDGEGQL